jgi:Flp pilus assembly protein TadG
MAMLLNRRSRRRGAHLVETALVFPIVMLLVAGLVVGAMGVFRYQQTAYLAREAARYAAVHGGQYQKDNAAAIAKGTLPNVTSAYLTTNIVQANASNLDPSQLQVAVNFNTSSGTYSWDDTAGNGNRWPYSSQTISGTTYNVTNTVSVTVTYQWIPEWFLTGPITLTSTSVMPMCY